MKETLLFQTISTLDKREIREIKKFLASPYFNQRDDVQTLFAFLSDSKVKNISKEKVFEALFPQEKKYDDHKIRLASSLLLQLIENFWAMEEAKSDTNKNKRMAAAQYRLRNLDKHFQRVYTEAKQSIDNQTIRNANYHFEQYELELEAYRFGAATRKEIENLQDISDSLDYAYSTLKLRQACLSLSYQSVYKVVNEQSMIPEIIEHIEENDLIKIPSVGTYYFAFKSLFSPEEIENFFQLKKMLFDFGNIFPNDEIRDLYLISINYCIKKHNTGEVDFLKAELELYQDGLKKKYLYINNFITKFTYRNVVTLALNLKEYDWAEKFIEEYKNELEPQQREGNYNHCKARLAYVRKNYNEVLIHLQKTDYEDILINISAKSLLLKALYELAEYDALEAHLEAMKTYIKRKNQLGYQQENYLHLIKYTKKLMLLSYSDIQNKEEIEGEIEALKSFADKKWLLEKLKEL
jgi:hypothetical protein